MIYVCRVDTGSRHIFDLADGIENVGSLANKIESQFKIEKAKQILLISGGEVLDDFSRKFYGYGFGCEESPIYLIDKSNVEKKHPPVVDLPLDILCQDMKQELQSAISLKPSLQTIQNRSQLTYKINELDKNIVKLCQCYYDDQYWQYQGYLTLIANLDEFLSSFKKKVQAIHEQFEFYLKNSGSYKDLMNEINKYIEILSHVPLLPSLIKPEDHFELKDLSSSTRSNYNMSSNNKQANLFSCFSTQSIPNLQSMQVVKKSTSSGEASNLNSPTGANRGGTDGDEIIPSPSNTDGENNSTKTILDWIKSTDPNNKLNAVIDETNEILNNFETSFKWNELNSKIGKLMADIDNSAQMREIEGLTKRLEDLKGFLNQANKFLINQSEINDSLQSNLQRAANLRDETILQDLCRGHERQLDIFRNNHSNLIEIANKISKAKLELIRVIHSRLCWIMQIQRQVADYDFQVQLYFKQLKKFNLRIRLMEQIKKAPSIYLEAVKETRRRMKFSQTYKTFANLMVDLVKNMHAEEMQRRSQFDSRTSAPNQHFILNILFRSLGDKLDLFVNDISGLRFDDQLPLISENELKSIEEEIYNQLKRTELPINDDFKREEEPSSEIEDPNLRKINTLIDTLINNDDSEDNNQKSPQNHQQPQEKSIPNITELKSSLSEIKQKLNATKSSFIDSKTEFEQLLKNLFEYNKNESERKERFYSRLFESLEKNDVGSVGNDIDSDSGIVIDNLDRTLISCLNSHLSKSKSDYDARINEMKQYTEQMKKTLVAEKQVYFNEAIKKLSMEKDRQIEELKLKQTEYLSRIDALEKSLNANTNTNTNKSTDISMAISTVTEMTSKAGPVDKLEQESDEFGDASKARLRELMLKERIGELEKQLAMLNTLPVTNNFYEAVQLNSCNVDDLVLAVYCEEYSSYKIIHKTSNYLHFVHSIVFKNFEHKSGNKININEAVSRTVNSTNSLTHSTTIGNNIAALNEGGDLIGGAAASSSPTTPDLVINNRELDQPNNSTSGATILSSINRIDETTSENLNSWFVGKVLVKEFCIAKKDKNRFKVPSGTRFYRVKLKPYLY